MTPFVAEIIGTMLLILMGAGVCANVSLSKTKAHKAGWMVVTTGWALGVFIGVVVAGPYSGAHLNPAVTIGLAVAGKFAWASVASYIGAQFIGAAVGAFLAWLSYRHHFNEPAEAGSKLGCFATIPQIRKPVNNLICELIGTFVLMFVVLYIAGGDARFGGYDIPVGLGSIGAIPVAFTVWVIGLALGGTTGYAINPARDLAPRIMHAILPIKEKGSSDWGYAWIPVVGPISGAVIAALLYIWIM